MITREFNLYLHAGHSIPLVINVNQYDQGEQWLFTLFNADGTQYVPSSGAIVGIKSDNLGIINSGTVDSQGRVVINETQQMTAAVGKAVFELVIDDGTHGTANFIVLVEPKPGDNADLSESDLSLIEQAIEAASSIKPYGSPLVASTVAGMTDHDKVYVYVGSETGYTSGNWYYWDGDSWESGGVYNSVAVQTDTTLAISGVAADAKKVGDEISDLKSQITNGVPSEVKQAIDTLFTHAVMNDYDGSAELATIHAWATAVNVLSITAVFNQGSSEIYTTDSLDTLKQYLTVTASYDNGTSSEVSGYTLSGTLTVGTSIITVSYGGKTTTFNVTVTERVLPEGYTQIEYVERPSGTQNTKGYNTTGFMPNGTDEVVIKMGIMATAAPSSSSGGYFLVCHQNSRDNTIGFGIGIPQNLLTAYAYDGTLADISPNGGSSIVNKKIELEVTKTSTGLTITDGTNSKTITSTPRAMSSNLYLFALYPSSGTTLGVPAFGRIYYLNITEGGVEKVNFIPCKRDSDDAIGFYDTVAETFKTSTAYVGGAEV